MHRSTQHSSEAESLISGFVDSDDRILILVGIFGQCMRDIVAMTTQAFSAPENKCTVLAPNARISSHYHSACGSLYGFIYESNAYFDNKKSKFIHELKTNNSPRNQNYIVGDAHLISDSYWASTSRQFGSGCLLNDFMDFVNLRGSERRIIFIGDPYQMQRQSDASSALNISKLQEYSESIKCVQLKEYKCDVGSGLFLENRELLADRIETRQFHRLAISLNDTDCVELSGDAVDVDQLIRNHDAITIAHTHAQVNEYNREIKRRVFNRAFKLTEGDLVVTHNSLRLKCEECAKMYDVPHQYYDIPSGSFGTVQSILKEEQVEQALRGRPKPVTVHFLNLDIQWKNIGCGHYHSHLCFRDHFYAEKPGINQDELIALVVDARSRKKEKEEMTGTPSEEGPDREHLDSPFFHAAMLRFGYAVTLHRAQGCLFKTVIADLFSENLEGGEGYFRWLYTAFSVPSKSMNLINVPRKSPFGRTVWKLDQGRLVTRISPNSLIEYNPSAPAPQDIKESPTEYRELRNLYSFLRKRLERINAGITKLVHHPYQEVYTFATNSTSTCIIQFYYNAKFQVTRMSVLQSTPSNFARRIQDALISSPVFQNTFQKEIYDILRHRLESHDIRIMGVEHQNCQEVYYVEGDMGRAKFCAYYNNKGAVTKMILANYNSEEFKQNLQSIFRNE